jgi:hypothetical protein
MPMLPIQSDARASIERRKKKNALLYKASCQSWVVHLQLSDRQSAVQDCSWGENAL